MSENPAGETPQEQVPPSSGSSRSSEWDELWKEMGVTAAGWAQTLGKAAEDLTGLMIIRTDLDLRQKLDLLVESGAVKTRAEALKLMVQSGLKKNEKVMEQVESTREKINQLRQQLKGLVNNN
jgi:hypothetical protein